MGGPELRAPTFAESLVIENYKGAITGALTSATAASDKIVAAAFSVATAFGAVIALVSPKDSTSSLWIALPFALIAIAVAAALYSESIAVSVELTDDLAAVKRNVDTAIFQKRLFGWIALGALAAAMIGAGFVLSSGYRASSKKVSPINAEVWLTSTGTKTLAQACGAGAASPVAGTVADAAALASTVVNVKVDKTACRNGGGTLVLPSSTIAIARLTP